jgi:tetratricopeptide (TPR) repeat protein
MNPLFDQAEKKRRSSRFKSAQRDYQRLLRLPSLAALERVQALLGLADVERIQGSFPESLRHYRQARLLSQSRDPSLAWDAQTGWALAARACGRPREALAVLQRTLKAYEKQGDLQGQAFVHWALGGTLRIAGGMKGGLRELLRALRMFKSLKDPEGTAYTCCALGGLYRMLGRYGNSGKYYREANRRMRRLDDTFGTAYSYCGLGNVERMAGRWEKALPFYRKAERLYGTIGDRVSYAYTLWSLGTTYKMMGAYSPAQKAFARADRLFQRTGDGRGRVYALLGFAEIGYLRGRKKEGLRNWRRARSLAASGSFAWEKLHVEALRGGKVRNLAARYLRAGSSFHPVSLPVNWP